MGTFLPKYNETNAPRSPPGAQNYNHNQDAPPGGEKQTTLSFNRQTGNKTENTPQK